jgi:hypothetical protein
MKQAFLKFGKGFKVIAGNRRVQAAQMVIEPGDSEGGPNNRHRGSDQWLLVVTPDPSFHSYPQTAAPAG